MSKGRARIAIGQGVSVWVLEAPQGFGDAAFHSHHAVQFTAALNGSLSLITGSSTLTAPMLAVAADVEHKFQAEGLLAFLFIEPESRAGRALSQRLFRDCELVEVRNDRIDELFRPLRCTFDAPSADEDLLRLGWALVEELAPDTHPPLPDPRVQKIIDYTARNLDQPLSLATASEGVHLSPSRLRHLFVEQTGLPYKTYILWLRLMRAVKAYSQGESLTAAAHFAGFSDSAHFSRVFRRTFGLPATTLTRI
jgi:AraC-like DNA-binding protein